MQESCEHLQALNSDTIIPLANYTKFECQECVKSRSSWVSLRICQACGTMLCCDSSPNQHASKHAKKSGHPVVISGQLGENWAWCYIDEQYKEPAIS